MASGRPHFGASLLRGVARGVYVRSQVQACFLLSDETRTLCGLSTNSQYLSTQGDKMIERLAILMFTMTLAACAASGPETASTGAAGSAQGGATTAATSGDGMDAANASDSEQVAAANVEPQEETVCRREKPAGSNISRKVCYKRSALDDRAEMDKDALRQMRSRPQLPSSNN